MLHRSARQLLTPAALLVCAVAPSPAAAQTHAAPLPGPAALGAAMDSLGDSLTSGPIVGLTIAVARGPELVLARGYGLADREANRPAEANSVYQIGSVTKQFTAAAIMRLVEQGRISLDDEVTRYLTDFPAQGHSVTIRQLLNHTSGIRSYTSFMPLTDSMPVSAIYEAIKEQPFDFEPGTDFRYNNSGYVLLGLVLESVTGRTYGDLLQEWFFTPLGLADTRYCGAGGRAVPEGYRPGATEPTRVAAVDMRVPFAAGALCSTAPDLARWTWALSTGKVVSPESYAAMTAGTTLPSGRRLSYGFGIVADTAHGRAVVNHGGGIPGFVSDLSLYPADSTIVVVLLNTNTDAGAVAARAAHIALGVEPDDPKDLPTAAAERARLAGTYTVEQIKLEVRIYEDGGMLMAQGAGQPSFRLLSQGNDVFLADFDRSVRLVFEEGDPAPAFVLHQGGGVLRAARK